MIYYLGNLKNDFYHAGNKARKDCETIFKNLNMKEIKLNYLSLSKFSKKLFYKCIDQGIAVILNFKFLFKDDFWLFSQFPVERKWGYLLFYNLKNIKIVSIIHDLDGLRFKNKEKLEKEIKYLKKSKYIISHNSKMTEFLIEKGVDKNKIKNLNIFDYILAENNREINETKTSDICFAGNLDKSLFLYKLKELKNIKMNVFGINYQKEKNQGDFNYCGAFPPDEIHKKLSGKYGLLWDGNSLEECKVFNGNYMEYINPHKLSLYIAAGLPVIDCKKSATSDFIKRENIGVSINSLYELEEILEKISKKEYEEKVKNVLKIREKIINGKVLTELIKEILNEEINE